jgi:catalase
MIVVNHALSGAPSILFDAVVLALPVEGAAVLASKAAAIDWVRDSFGHLKVIGHVVAAAPLLKRAGIDPDPGLVAMDGERSITKFVTMAKTG